MNCYHELSILTDTQFERFSSLVKQQGINDCPFVHLHQGQNGRHERIDFLTSREKKPSKQKTGILIGVLVGLLLLAGLAALLIWLFVCKSVLSYSVSWG